MSECMHLQSTECGRNPEGGCHACEEFWKALILGVLPDNLEDLKLIYLSFKYPLVEEVKEDNEVK